MNAVVVAVLVVLVWAGVYLVRSAVLEADDLEDAAEREYRERRDRGEP